MGKQNELGCILTDSLQVFPPVKYVLDKFRHKLPKDDLKRLGKDIAKKLVASDFKNNRVRDPTAKLTEKQERKIKTYVKEFLDRAVHKYEAHKNEGKGAENGRTQDQAKAPDSSMQSPRDVNGGEADADGTMSDVDMDSPGSRKRKREDGEGEGEGDNTDTANATPSDAPDMKRLKEDDSSGAVASPPPPPPPPPTDTATDEAAMTEEQKELREQEEALMRENEEAQRLDDEANANGEGTGLDERGQSRKQEVLSH